ncbi:MAG: hypothetical protein IKH45_07880 [Neisseriaceae bacterium]|nr:hypothetical protein [Neisseriaceae bacterium]
MALNCFTRIDNVDFMCVLVFFICHYSLSANNDDFFVSGYLKNIPAITVDY